VWPTKTISRIASQIPYEENNCLPKLSCLPFLSSSWGGLYSLVAVGIITLFFPRTEKDQVYLVDYFNLPTFIAATLLSTDKH
jgi:hypothetical protein